jgi:hypothetical protein
LRFQAKEKQIGGYDKFGFLLKGRKRKMARITNDK